MYSDPAYAGVVAELKRELDRLRSELKVPAEPPAEASGQSGAGRGTATRPRIGPSAGSIGHRGIREYTPSHQSL